MSNTYFTLLTAVGEAMLANASALGTVLRITQMGVGDGNGNLPQPSRTQTALVHEVRRAALNQLSIDPANASQIIAEQVIPETEGGWWVREVGLYDEAGDLIAVGNCPPTYKPLLAEGSGRTQVIRMVLLVSSTSAVELKIDPSVVLATRAYADQQDAKRVAKAGDTMTGLLTTPGVNAFGTAGFANSALAVSESSNAHDKILIRATQNGEEMAIDVVKKDNSAFSTMILRGTQLRWNNETVWHSGNFVPGAKQDALGFVPVQQGTGIGQGANTIKLGWSDLGKLKVTVDASDIGPIAMEAGNNTFSGANTFAQSPVVPTPATNDNSLNAANTAFVHAVVAALVGSVPASLDTLKELADALGNDANFAATVNAAIAARLTQAQADARYAQLSGGQTFANPITVANRLMVSHGGDADGGVDMVDPGTNGGGAIRWIDNAGWVGAIEQRSRAAASNAGLMSLSNIGGFSFSIGSSSRFDIRSDQIVLKAAPVQINPGNGVALDLLNSGGNNYGRSFNISTTGGQDGPFMTFNRFSSTTQSFWQLGIRPESDSTDFAIGVVDNGFGDTKLWLSTAGTLKAAGNLVAGNGNSAGETTLTLGAGNGYFFTNPNAAGFNTPGSVDGYFTYNRAKKNLTVSGWDVWHNGNSGASLSANGYQKLPSGLILQWGTVAVATDSTASIVFPTAFPTVCVSIVGNGDTNNIDTSGARQTAATFIGVSNTGCTICNDTLTQNCRWIAIGY